MIHSHKNPVIEELAEKTGFEPSRCYQCGKCSAGCPVREFSDFSPNKVIRLLQLGHFEEVLKSKAIWLCAGCMTCSTRCPQEYNLAATMDVLREIALRLGYVNTDKDTVSFHKSFLDQIKNHGRTYEMGLVMQYKLKTMHLMKDVDVAPSMFLKGKLNISPTNIKNKEQIKEIFRKSKEENK